MNRSQFLDNIRTVTQADSTELPDATLLIYLQQAWEHCAYYKPNWPFYRQTWTHAFAGDGSTYQITQKTLIAANQASPWVAGTPSPATPNSIEAVYDTTSDNKLSFIDNAEFEKLYRANDTTTGDPRCYTITQGQWSNSVIDNIGWTTTFTIKLWPIPSDGVTYNLRFDGFREPVSFVQTNDGYTSGTVPGSYYSSTASSAIPDMPIAFHNAILNYAIGLAFAHLDEGDRVVFHTTLCDQILAQQEKVWFRAPVLDGPIVFGGGQKRGAYNTLPARLTYDWESR